METSDSVISLIRDVASNSAEATSLREKLTMDFVPRGQRRRLRRREPHGSPIIDVNGKVPAMAAGLRPRFTTGPVPAFYQRGRRYDITLLATRRVYQRCN
jgi:hypothetical protein